MSCNYCCGADKLFDIKGAQKELKKYRKKGPGKPTQKLIDLLFQNDVNSKSLLDIGGGIGAIQWAFLNKGGKNTIDVDASNGYLSVANSFAEEKGFSDVTQFIQGDLVDKCAHINSVDFVSLDKVICCYPDYKSLLSNALDKCNSTIGIVYPYGNILAKMVVKLEMIYFWARNIQFGTFIHNPTEVENFVIDQGFQIIKKTTSFPWHVQIYNRIGS